jgi:hypothetical protein
MRRPQPGKHAALLDPIRPKSLSAPSSPNAAGLLSREPIALSATFERSNPRLLEGLVQARELLCQLQAPGAIFLRSSPRPSGHSSSTRHVCLAGRGPWRLRPKRILTRALCSGRSSSCPGIGRCRPARASTRGSSWAQCGMPSTCVNTSRTRRRAAFRCRLRRLCARSASPRLGFPPSRRRRGPWQPTRWG